MSLALDDRRRAALDVLLQATGQPAPGGQQSAGARRRTPAVKLLVELRGEQRKRHDVHTEAPKLRGRDLGAHPKRG
jgi:hypothetical protein